MNTEMDNREGNQKADPAALTDSERAEIVRLAKNADGSLQPAASVYRYLRRCCFRCFGPVQADGENALICADLVCGLRISPADIETVLGGYTARNAQPLPMVAAAKPKARGVAA